MNRDSYALFDATKAGVRWAAAARRVATRISEAPGFRAANLRHGQTWSVGVDALPNAADAAVDGVALNGDWQAHVPAVPLHRAQVSIVYPGYPGRDADETATAHRFRLIRQAAHVDGLLPVGPARRRFPREFHAYILGLPLNRSDNAPTVVWPGSHIIMQAALSAVIGARDPATVDVTEAYNAARRDVFDRISPVSLQVPPGGAFLMHRFALHGTAPWTGPAAPARMIAFFRPEFASAQDWLR
ncbi:hypothetical protein [uncultured Tateyamaria sp.]|uniref:hypothetical protein n=1 Tax=Tateyamaria sp. 1078 TaxID=3417464 RepID=UPI00262F87EE|nr:hypothetical protein [uncultured Tateyamaria sp.]